MDARIGGGLTLLPLLLPLLLSLLLSLLLFLSADVVVAVVVLLDLPAAVSVPVSDSELSELSDINSNASSSAITELVGSGRAPDDSGLDDEACGAAGLDGGGATGEADEAVTNMSKLLTGETPTPVSRLSSL